MKLKTLLISSTAVALLAASGVALAAGSDNYSKLIQDGTDNTALITQGGNFNRVNLATQENKNNDLEVSQTAATASAAVEGNKITSITQTATKAGVDPTNVLTIDQETDPSAAAGNKITTVVQSHSKTGAANVMSIVQSGVGNSIGTASQDGSNNNLDITQTGTSNLISSATITGKNNGSGTFDQAATSILNNAFGMSSGEISQSGTDNRVNLGIDADDTEFGILQNGNHNRAGTVSVTGNRNEFVLVQSGFSGGDNNILSLASIAGTDNDVIVYQWGNDNLSSVEVLDNDNHAGTSQSGNNNTAALALSGGDNISAIAQEGDNNNATVTTTGGNNVTGALQGGNYNYAKIDVTGANNGVVGIQVETAGSPTQRNYMKVAVTGNNNNAVTRWEVPTFTNSAANALAVTSETVEDLRGSLEYPSFVPTNVATALDAAHSLTPGALVQIGHDNDLTLTVGSEGSNSNNNQFGTLQNGDYNAITGTIEGGHGNTAAIMQVGNSNTANFSQTGSNNVAVISQ